MYAFSLGSFFICRRRKKNERKSIIYSDQFQKGILIKFVIKLVMLFLDACLKEDPNSRVACEVFATTDLVVIGGEITTTARS